MPAKVRKQPTKSLTLNQSGRKVVKKKPRESATPPCPVCAPLQTGYLSALLPPPKEQ